MKAIINSIIFMTIVHPNLHSEEIAKVSAEPREVLIQFIEIAKAFAENPNEQNKNRLRGNIAVFRSEKRANTFLTWITDELSGEAKKITIHQKFWQKGDVAVCVIIQNKEHGFVDVDPMIMFKTKTNNRWVLAGTINLAEDCELYAENEETVATLLKSYDDAEDGIRRPLFEESQRRRTVEQGG